MTDDNHDKLVKAYLEYFKAHENYQKTGGIRPRRETRRWLREIRDLAKIRMNEVQDSYVNRRADSKQDDQDN